MHISFGQETDDWVHLGDGWRPAGAAFRGSMGATCDLWLEHPGAMVDSAIEIEASAAGGASQPQRVTLAMRGEIIGRTVVGARRRLAFNVPARLLATRGPIRLQFRHEPGSSTLEPKPGDRQGPALNFRSLRLLPSAELTYAAEPRGGLSQQDIVQATLMPAKQFITLFEPLGENCEFGSGQRPAAAEPLSLLRFGAPKLPRLIECLHARFRDFGKFEHMRLSLSADTPPEYLVHETHYGMTHHSFQFIDAANEAEIAAQHARRLQLLARKLLEDLEHGEKILVWHAFGERAREQDVRALHAAISAIGPGRLLWIEAADTSNPPGSVVQVSPGLMRGHIHGFSRLYDRQGFDIEPWLAVCLEAHRLSGMPGDVSVAADATASARPALLPHPEILDVLAHVQDVGDTLPDADGWAGRRGSGLAIEGFTICMDPFPLLAGLRYQGLRRDMTLTGSAPMGEYCGTRGQCLAFHGFVMHAPETLLDAYELLAEAGFVDGSQVGPVSAGELCVAPGRQPLEAFRLSLRVRQ